MIPTITTWLFVKQLCEGEICFPAVVDCCALELGAIAIEIPRATYPDWSPAGLRELFAACPSEYLQLNFDTGNLYEGPAGNLQLLDLPSTHAHVKPTYRDLEGNHHDAEAERVLAELAKTGYRGTVTLEHIDGDPRENLPRVWEEFCAMLARVSQQNRRI